MSVVALLGNPMNGRAEGWRVVAYFTTMERAVAYEKAARLPGGDYSESGPKRPGEHYAGFDKGVWRYSYREGSLLRDCNPMPEERTSYQDGRYVELPDVHPHHPAPLNPEPLAELPSDSEAQESVSASPQEGPSDGR